MSIKTKIQHALKRENWPAIIIVLIFVFGTIVNPLIGRFGNEQVGSFFEKDDYEAKYFVNLFPEKDKTKNYRLVADIEKDTVCIKISRDERECEITYYLRKVYWPNGGYFSFDANECLLNEGKNFCFPDQQEEGIYIETTKKRVEDNYTY